MEKEELNRQDTMDSYRDTGTQGLNTNRAITNKWIGFVPLETALGKEFKNLELDLVRFTIPAVEIGTTSTSYKGVTVDLPTKVINPSSREITFEYKISEDWFNYRALYIWAAGLGIINPITEEGVQATINGENVAQALGVNSAGTGVFTDLLDCRVWMLNHYKKRIMDFTFHNCFIKRFSDLALDYANADEVTHSFTLVYTHMTLDMPHT